MSVRILVVILALFVLGQWLRLWRLRILGPGPSRPGADLVALRKAAGWRWFGLALGLFAATQVARLGPLGLGLMFAPAVLGLGVIGGVAVGELAMIPRRDEVGTAAVQTRTMGDYLPRRLAWLVAASTLLLGAILVTTTLIGSADDGGRAGRSLLRRCSARVVESASPWPGLYYSVPLAIALVAGMLCAGVALRTVAHRPRSGSAGEVAADDLLRRRSAEAVVAATGVMVSLSLVGVSLTAAGRLLGFSCPPPVWTVLGFALLAVAALMSLLLIWCLALLLAGPRIRPRLGHDTRRHRDGARV